MKKFINGRRYDTATAKEIGSYQHSNRTQVDWYDEKLYKKSTGEFFLHGEGGPASKYQFNAGENRWSGGEKILPLTLEKARAWAEAHLGADEYEKLFYVAEEVDIKEKAAIHLWIPVEQKKQAENLNFSYAEIFAAGLKSLS